MSANKGSDHIVIAPTSNDDQGGGAVSSASKDQASCKDTLHIMARRVRHCTSPQKIRHVMELTLMALIPFLKALNGVLLD